MPTSKADGDLTLLFGNQVLNESFYENEDVTYADYVSILSDAALGLHEDTLDYMTNRVSSLLETTLVINEGVNIEIYKKSSAVSKEYKFLCKALRKQLKAMKEELNIEYTINDYEFLNATVISRNISHWYNTI